MSDYNEFVENSSTTPSLSWRERIGIAKAVGHFTEADIEDSKHWHSCKIGEKYQLKTDSLPSEFNRESSIQYQLGMDFYAAVHRNDINTAEELCRKIDSLGRD